MSDTRAHTWHTLSAQESDKRPTLGIRSAHPCRTQSARNPHAMHHSRGPAPAHPV